MECEEGSETKACSSTLVELPTIPSQVYESNERINNYNNDEAKSMKRSVSNNENLFLGNKFSVDYSKRGTAKCKVCKKVIVKNEIRIGKSVPFKTTHIIQYQHVNCTFKRFQKARVASNVITEVSEIDGFETIKNEDKSRITELIEKDKASRTRPLAK